MNEVSGRFAKWVYESGLSDGVEETGLLEGVTVDRAVLVGGRQRIPWDDYIQMLENYHAAVGLAKMRDTALAFGTTQELEFFSKIAGVFLSPKNLYRFMYRWAGNHFLRNVNFDFATSTDGTFRIVSRVAPETRDSPVFFETLTNVLAGAPCRVGRPPAEVRILEMQPHRAEYEVAPPRSASVGWYLKWPLRAVSSVPALGSIFARQQEEIKQSHSAITRQREDFRSMVEQISDCVFILDADGQTLFANATARTAFGIDKASVDRSSPAGWLDADSKIAWERFLVSEGEGAHEFRFHVDQDDAEPVERTLSFGAPGHTLFGETDALLLIGRDVTEAREVEARLREVAYEERRRIAGDLHDGLGQVLTGINWQANLLATQLRANGNETHADAAISIADLATNSTRQARDLAHGLAGLDERKDNLRRALNEHCGKIERESALKVDLQLPDAEQPLSAPGQTALEIVRIVQEATHNAIKHGQGSQLVISVETDEERWVVTIGDDGKGLTKDAAAASTGLGIRSMQYRAAAINGAVELRPRSEGGTELVLTLPAQQLGSFEAAEKPETRISDQIESGDGLRVMVADDHETVLQGIVALLGAEEGMAICCQTGERDEIVALAIAQEPDVLVVDMLMDGDDNIDNIRRLRAALPNLRIVVLSMFHEEQYGGEAIAAGANAYVMKQAPPAELVAQVRAV